MCGRYTLAKGEGKWEFAHFRVEWKGPNRFNIAPSQFAPIIRMEQGEPVVRTLRWGLVPSWAKDANGGARLANARGETVASKPSFRAAFRSRRCFVPADGYYEWQTLGRRKQPWRFVRPDRSAFLMAGLWESWTDPGGSELETFSLITTTPNAVAATVHDRMPVILDGADVDAWLNDATAPEALQALIRACPEDRLTAYPVDARVGSPANDDPACIDPLPERVLTSLSEAAKKEPPVSRQGELF